MNKTKLIKKIAQLEDEIVIAKGINADLRLEIDRLQMLEEHLLIFREPKNSFLVAIIEENNKIKHQMRNLECQLKGEEFWINIEYACRKVQDKTITELTAENAASKAVIISLQAKLEELIEERNLAWNKGYYQGRDDAHQTIVALQAKVEELTAANNEAYSRGWVDALDEEYQRAGWMVSDE